MKRIGLVALIAFAALAGVVSTTTDAQAYFGHWSRTTEGI